MANTKAIFNLNLKEMKVKIRDAGEISIIGYTKNLSFYKNWQIREARLVLREDKAFLKVSLLKDEADKVKDVKAKDGIAVDINMKDIVAGKNDSNYVRLSTRIEEARHYKSLAEQLQSIVEGIKRIRGFTIGLSSSIVRLRRY